VARRREHEKGNDTATDVTKVEASLTVLASHESLLPTLGSESLSGTTRRQSRSLRVQATDCVSLRLPSSGSMKQLSCVLRTGFRAP
jgi:hypothetical protein